MRGKHTALAMSLALLFACATVSEEDAKKASTHRRLAEAQLRQNAVELAIREYRAARALNPSDPEILFGLAEAYRRKGMLDEAEQALKGALDLNPEHHDARLNLCVIYLLRERWDDAIQLSTELFDDPTFIRPSRALVNRGWAHYKSGDFEAAESDLREALVTDRGNFHAHLDLGVVLFDRGEVLDSMVHFERVLSILKRRPPAIFGAAEAQTRFHLAQAHVKLGQREKAIEQLRAASERGGESEWGRKSKEYLSLLE